MKTSTYAVAAAGLLGAVVADNDWEQWSSAEPVDATTAPAATTDGYSWPAEGYTTPEAAVTTPAASTTWSEWTTTTSPSPVEPVTTSTTTWSEWTTSSTPVMETTTTSSTPSAETTTSSTWSVWSQSTTSQPVEATSSTTAPAGGSTWSQWSSASGTPVEATSGPAVTSTALLTSTVYSTLTVYPNSDTTVTATVTASNTVTYTGAPSGQCPINIVTSYGSPTWSPTPASSSSSWSAWSGSSSVSASSASTWSAWSSTSSAPVAGSSSTTWAAWTSTSAAPPKSTGGSGGLSANGDKFGMTYSPYTNEGGCKDKGTVEADISKIASLGFALVRVYSTDCDTLINVGGAARDNGLKIILGVFISETGISGAQPQVQEIIAWGQWDIVELIVVGNEAVFQGFVSAGDLAGFISSSASAFKGAGYTGPCTTTEELSVWQQYGTQWCGVIDVVAANLYAFFNPTITAEGAGDFIQSQIDELNTICPSLQSYVMENGWPSAADSCNGVACASPENQATAINGVLQTSGSKVVFFSFEDEQWKPAGQWGAEQHFGCASVFE